MSVVELETYKLLRPLPPAQDEVSATARARKRLGRYGGALMVGVATALALWTLLQLACVLALFGYAGPVAEAGIIDGSVAFRFWGAVDYVNPAHAHMAHFRPEIFPPAKAVAFSSVLILASAPLVIAMGYLIRLLESYRRQQIFGQGNARDTQMLAVSTIATGTSPFFLAPIAHLIGMLKPVTGVSGAMIGVTLIGCLLLVVSLVMDIGVQLQREQESFL